MKLIQKIKTFFIKNDFGSWKNFRWDRYEIVFNQVNDDILLDIGSYIRANLNQSRQIGNKRHRLAENASTRCADLDSLLPIVSDIIKNDYAETVVESQTYNWDFSYFVAKHERCENTIRICNVLRSKDENPGNCIYPLITIRKFNGHYYCWNHAN